MDKVMRDPNHHELHVMGIKLPAPSPAALPSSSSAQSSETLPNLVVTSSLLPPVSDGKEGEPSSSSNRKDENNNNNNSNNYDSNNNSYDNNNDDDGAEITSEETKEQDEGEEEDDGDSETEEKSYLRQPEVIDMILYFIFLIVFVGVSFSSGPPDTAYWLSYQIQNAVVYQEFHFSDSQFKKVFFDINNAGDFWNFLTGPFLDNVYDTTWYNGQALPSSELNFINYAAKIVGPVRLRQKRVKKDSCKIHSFYTPLITMCNSKLTGSNEDKLPFGPNNTWVYSAPQGLYDSYLPYIYRYDGGGYLLNLDSDANKASEQIWYLKNNSWVDLETRVIFIDFTVYDTDMDLFCSARLTVEFPPSTGAVPSANFIVSPVFQYVTPSDFARLFFELIIVAFVIFYAYQEIMEMKMQRMDYLTETWNFIDCLNILVFIVVIIMRIFTVSYLSWGKFNVNDESFASIFPLVELQKIERSISATNAFVSWFKLFKYVRMNKRLSQLTDTLSNAAADIVIFMFIFFIVFFGYAQAGWMLFSVDIDNFRTLVRSMYTLLRQILGDFDFDSIEQSNQVLGPLFFFSFSILVLFILMNMFLAIINDTYSEVKMNSKAQKEKATSFKAIVKNAIDDMKETLKRDKSKVHRIRRVLKEVDQNKLLDESEVMQILRKKGDDTLEGKDLHSIISQFDKDQDGKLNGAEVDELLDFLHEKVKSIDRMEKAIENDQPRIFRQLAAEGAAGVQLSKRNLKASVMGKVSSTAQNAKPTPTTEAVLKKIESLESRVEEIISLFHGLEERLKQDDQPESERKKKGKIPKSVLFSIYGNKKPPQSGQKKRMEIK